MQPLEGAGLPDLHFSFADVQLAFSSRPVTSHQLPPRVSICSLPPSNHFIFIWWRRLNRLRPVCVLCCRVSSPSPWHNLKHGLLHVVMFSGTLRALVLTLSSDGIDHRVSDGRDFTFLNAPSLFRAKICTENSTRQIHKTDHERHRVHCIYGTKLELPSHV